jgi:hypothetical protein
MVRSELLIEKMASQSKSFRNARGSYIAKNPSFNSVKDARITVFSKCIVTIQSLWISFLFRTLDLKNDWWDKIGPRLIEFGLKNTAVQKIEIPTVPSDRDSVTSEFERYITYAYLLLLFSSLESLLRIIVKEVYPTKFLDRQGNFKGNFNDISKSLLKSKYSKYEDLLELLRLLRNTNHNNGVYMPDMKGDNRTVSYKRKTYQFTDGLPVDLGDAIRLFLFNITPDILKLIKDIVNSSDVVKQVQIIDPFVK